jgi:hypothetical protein
MELIEDSLYEEVFELLEKNATKIEDSIERKRYIRNVFGGLFEEEVFVDILNQGKWSDLAVAVSVALGRPFFEDMKNRFGTMINIEEASKIVSILIVDGKYEAAKTFLPYANKDLSLYDSTLNTIMLANNINSLRFVCENFENIHFNFEELLSRAAGMGTESIVMLMEDFGFDLQLQGRQENNLVVRLLRQGQIKTFDWLNKNNPEKIDYGNEVIYKLIEREIVDKGLVLEFISSILSNPYLKKPHIEKIGNFLFNSKNVEKFYQSDIYEKFFTHRSFDEQIFTLGQGYFIYGLLAKIGITSKRDGSEVANYYVSILNSYLNTYEKDEVPDSPELHIVGAAVQVAKVGNCKSATEACVLIMRRFGKYINRPNPSGLLPISQVEKESPLFRILVNNGAVPPEPEPTFWTSVFGIFKNKTTLQYMPQQSATSVGISSKPTSITSIRVKMRNDFRAMREYIANENCDAEIKMKCENMFLKADKLGLVMEKNNLSSFTDELHFLSENFSNYLKQSLKAYTDLVFTTKNLDEVSTASKKIDHAKKVCLNHVNLLFEQLDLISGNISNGLSDGALSQLKVRSKFLEQRFNQSIDSEDDLGEESKIVQVMPEKKK